MYEHDESLSKDAECVVPKFPVFSLSGKIDNQIPCFLCAVATLTLYQQIHLLLFPKSKF